MKYYFLALLSIFLFSCEKEELPKPEPDPIEPVKIGDVTIEYYTDNTDIKLHYTYELEYHEEPMDAEYREVTFTNVKEGTALDAALVPIYPNYDWVGILIYYDYQYDGGGKVYRDTLFNQGDYMPVFADITL